MAWVRLKKERQMSSNSCLEVCNGNNENLLWEEWQVRTINLVEPPEQILGSAVDVVSARVVWKVVGERRTTELLLEKIDLVQEQDYAGPHEPPRVDNGIEEHQALHHSVLDKAIEAKSHVSTPDQNRNSSRLQCSKVLGRCLT